MREWLDRRDAGGFDRLTKLAHAHADERPQAGGGMAAPGCTTATRVPGELIAGIGSHLLVPALPRALADALARISLASEADDQGDVWLVRHPDGMLEAMTPTFASVALAAFEDGGGFLVASEADRGTIAGRPVWDETRRMAA